MQKVLVIGKTWPEPKTTGAGRRMLQICKTLTAKYHVHFASAAQKSAYSTTFEGLPVETHSVFINDDGFDQFLEEIQPDIVVFDRFHTEEQFGWRVAERLPNALLILNMEDFHGLRAMRDKRLINGELENEQGRLIASDQINETVLREISSIYRCDRTWVISRKEMDVLDSLGVSKDLLHYLPFHVADFYHESGFLSGFSDRKNLIFFGNFLHAPNADAITRLCAIWPEILAQIPHSELHIYGAYGESIKALQNLPEGIVFKGWVDNIAAVLTHYKILLAPLRFGAGIKTKIVESIGCGLPVISTPIGWEGICDNDEDLPGFSCIDNRELIAAVLSLYQSRSSWEKAQEQAAIWMPQNANHWESNLLKQLNQDFEEMTSRRANNIIGRILQWNSHKTYKYLSKYIMAKNSKTD